VDPKASPREPEIDGADASKDVAAKPGREGNQRAEGASKARFSEVLAGQAKVDQSAATSTTAQIANELKTKQIDATNAAHKLIDEIVFKKAESLAPAMREQLRATLTRMLEEDPLLASRLRELKAAAEREG
jgi:hypothetical protein